MTDETGQHHTSNGSLEVRKLAAPARIELQQLASIFDDYRAHYGEVADAQQTASWLAENIGSGRLEAFVAEDDGELVGFATTTAVPASLRLGRFWQIRDLFVVPGRRRLGVGRALLDRVRAAAISAGATRLVLQTEVDNTPALRLYAESGYTTIDGYCTLSLSLQPDRPRYEEEIR